jgi:flagellar biosynthesis GTPase FlhF
MPYIKDYPASAANLPDKLKAHAYNDVPVDFNIPALDTILSDKKMRGRGKDMAWLSAVPEEYRAMVVGQVSKHRNSNTQPSSADAHDGSMPNATILRGLSMPSGFSQFLKTEHGVPSSSVKKEEHVPPPAPKKEPVRDLSSEKDDDELDDMERRMIEASRTRASKKGAVKKAASKKTARKKGAGKKDAKAEQMSDDDSDQPEDAAAVPVKMQKKPACKPKAAVKLEPAKAVAAAKPCKKKPAAAPSKEVSALVKKIDMKDVFKRLRKKRHDEGMYRNKFTSAAYAAGRKRAKDYGAAVEIAKGFGSVQLQTAGTLWDDSCK